MFNGAVKKLSPVERKYQEDVDRKVVIASVQDKLPKISKQNGASEREEKEEKEEKEVQRTDKEDKKDQDQDEILDQKQDQESSESTADPGEEQLMSKTPDLVPKSFQDKR